jgi:hypothetical protein
MSVREMNRAEVETYLACVKPGWLIEVFGKKSVGLPKCALCVPAPARKAAGYFVQTDVNKGVQIANYSEMDDGEWRTGIVDDNNYIPWEQIAMVRRR